MSHPCTPSVQATMCRSFLRRNRKASCRSPAPQTVRGGPSPTSADRVALGICLPRASTDLDVRNERIRFPKLRLCFTMVHRVEDDRHR